MRGLLINRSYRNQRGFSGVIAILLLLSVLFLVLAVDASRLWMQRRNLQKITDIAAMAAAQQLGCSASQSSVLNAAQAAAAANNFSGNLGDLPNQVVIGEVSNTNGVRHFMDAGSGAVKVYATQTVPASLVAGGLFGGTVLLHAEAVSRADSPLAALGVGTFTVSLTADDAQILNALLTKELGSNVSLDAVSYQGIAATKITLLDLLKASNQVGGVRSLLDSQFSLRDLLLISGTAVAQNSVASVGVINDVGTLANASINQAKFNLADVLGVSLPDSNAAATVGVNLLSLITTAAMVANGQHAVSLPLTIQNVPGISTVTGQVNIISPPKMAIGPAGNTNGVVCTTLSTAQVDVRVSVLATVLGLATLDISLHTSVGQGSASLGPIADDGSHATAQVQAMPGIAAWELSNSSATGDAAISASIFPLGVVKIGTIKLKQAIAPSLASQLIFDVSHPVIENLPQTKTVSSSLGGGMQNALSDPATIQVTALGLNNSLLNSVVSQVVSPLLGEIGRVLLDPLLNLLGIKVGGMDVILMGVQIRQTQPLII